MGSPGIRGSLFVGAACPEPRHSPPGSVELDGLTEKRGTAKVTIVTCRTASVHLAGTEGGRRTLRPRSPAGEGRGL